MDMGCAEFFTSSFIHSGFGKDLTGKHEVRIIAKTFSLVGPYNINGKVLILPISGTGKSNMTMGKISRLGSQNKPVD